MIQLKQPLLDKVDISYISDSVHKKSFIFSKYSNSFGIFEEQSYWKQFFAFLSSSVVFLLATMSFQVCHIKSVLFLKEILKSSLTSVIFL